MLAAAPAAPLLPPQGKEKFLGILNKYMEIHGTVYYESQRPPEVPAFVKNHGLLPQPEFQQLLRKAKVSPAPASRAYPQDLPPTIRACPPHLTLPLPPSASHPGSHQSLSRPPRSPAPTIRAYPLSPIPALTLRVCPHLALPHPPSGACRHHTWALPKGTYPEVLLSQAPV